MAEGLREHLAAAVDRLRSDVLSAGVLNAKCLRTSAADHLADIRSFVDETSELQSATFETCQGVTVFARLLYEQSAIAAVEDARRQTLAAIDGLVAALQTTNPSERARSLGL